MTEQTPEQITAPEIVIEETDSYAAVSRRIEKDWYPLHENEEFTQKDICEFFGWKERATKQCVSHKLYHDYKETKSPVLEKVGKGFRIIDRSLDDIDWQSADSTATLNLLFPFDLHNYVKLFPKSVAVVAGEPNAGKTAFMYNFIVMNMRFHSMTLYNSETSPEQMKERFANFEMEIPTPAPWRTVERYDNFADVIDPDGISVIDYVDCDTDFYMNGAEISRIYKKLRKGFALIGLQKKRNQTTFKGQEIKYDVGYGGDMTLKRPSLYVAMGGHKLKIVKGKSWVDPAQNPNGMEWSYKLVGGSKFVQVERIFSEEQ